MLIGITQPQAVNMQREARQVTSMLQAGLDIFHLRKPDWHLDALGEMMERIPLSVRNQISWHLPHCFRDLISLEGWEQVIYFTQRYGLNRVHLPEWWRQQADLAAFRNNRDAQSNLLFSTSCHDIQTASALLPFFDYVCLGPLFNSISKTGYQANPELLTEVNGIRRSEATPGSKMGVLIGLGGIHDHHLTRVKSAGFGGAAMLGSIWGQATEGQQFTYIKNCRKLWNE